MFSKARWLLLPRGFSPTDAARVPIRAAASTAPAEGRPAGAEEDKQRGQQPAHIPTGTLTLLFFWLGAISVGGRSVGYIRDEVVERRKWMRITEFMEAMSFALVLPGPTGPNLALYVGQSLQGKLAGALAVVAYVLPGSILILLLTMFTDGADRPDWVDGGLRGAGAGALGLLVTICVRNVGPARAARYGLLVAALSAVASGVIGVPLVGVLLGLGGLSLYLNRPKGVQG